MKKRFATPNKGSRSVFMQLADDYAQLKGSWTYWAVTNGLEAAYAYNSVQKASVSFAIRLSLEIGLGKKAPYASCVLGLASLPLDFYHDWQKALFECAATSVSMLGIKTVLEPLLKRFNVPPTTMFVIEATSLAALDFMAKHYSDGPDSSSASEKDPVIQANVQRQEANHDALASAVNTILVDAARKKGVVLSDIDAHIMVSGSRGLGLAGRLSDVEIGVVFGDNADTAVDAQREFIGLLPYLYQELPKYGFTLDPSLSPMVEFEGCSGKTAKESMRCLKSVFFIGDRAVRREAEAKLLQHSRRLWSSSGVRQGAYKAWLAASQAVLPTSLKPVETTVTSFSALKRGVIDRLVDSIEALFYQEDRSVDQTTVLEKLRTLFDTGRISQELYQSARDVMVAFIDSKDTIPHDIDETNGAAFVEILNGALKPSGITLRDMIKTAETFRAVAQAES